jgi:diguanylate cyclase (GGDEF)-like protein
MFIRFILLLLSFHALAFSTTVLTDNSDKYEAFSIGYFYDEERQFSIDDVQNQAFQNAPSQFSFGYKEGDAWFKIELTNKSQTDEYILYFTEPLWEELDLYESSNDGWKVYHAGLLTPLEERQINDVNPAFFLSIPKGKSKTIYVKGTSSSAQMGEFQIFTDKEFFRPTRFSITDLYIFYTAFLLIITLFNLYLFTAKREMIYAYYIGYVFFLSIWISVLSGSYIILGLPPWNEGLHASGALLVVFLILFSNAFIELKNRIPLMHTVFNAFAWVIGLLSIAITLNLPYTPFILNLVTSVFFTLLLIISVKVWKQGHIKMRYYLVALMVYMPAMGMMTMNYNGLLENTDVTRYAFVFGSLIEVLFFNSLMVSRFHALFQDKIRIQSELIHQKERHEQVLEDEIRSRTNDLQKTNEHLLQQTKELEKTKEKLIQQATIDILSSLYNRRYFTDVSSRSFDGALRYKKNLSIMMLDLDDFKDINDTYGHAVGDKVIVQAAKVIKDSIRSSDIAARYGGEEFIILVPQIDSEEARSLANRICKDIEKSTVQTDAGKTVDFTVSIGIAHIQLENDTDIEQIIRRADKALYTAKAKNKNQVVETA